MRTFKLAIYTILTLSAITLAAPSIAQQPQQQQQRTAISPELLQNYYNGCVAGTSNPVMSDLTKASFCQCTAAQIGPNISMEEMTRANTDKAVQEKILLQVYAPCVQYPTHELILNQCRSNQQLAANPAICPCVAKNMALHVAKVAQTELKAALEAKTPDINPVNAVLESPSAQAEQKRIALGCVSGAIN